MGDETQVGGGTAVVDKQAEQLIDNKTSIGGLASVLPGGDMGSTADPAKLVEQRVGAVADAKDIAENKGSRFGFLGKIFQKEYVNPNLQKENKMPEIKAPEGVGVWPAPVVASTEHIPADGAAPLAQTTDGKLQTLPVQGVTEEAHAAEITADRTLGGNTAPAEVVADAPTTAEVSETTETVVADPPPVAEAEEVVEQPAVDAPEPAPLVDATNNSDTVSDPLAVTAEPVTPQPASAEPSAASPTTFGADQLSVYNDTTSDNAVTPGETTADITQNVSALPSDGSSAAAEIGDTDRKTVEDVASISGSSTSVPEYHPPSNLEESVTAQATQNDVPQFSNKALEQVTTNGNLDISATAVRTSEAIAEEEASKKAWDSSEILDKSTDAHSDAPSLEIPATPDESTTTNPNTGAPGADLETGTDNTEATLPISDSSQVVDPVKIEESEKVEALIDAQAEVLAATNAGGLNTDAIQTFDDGLPKIPDQVADHATQDNTPPNVIPFPPQPAQQEVQPAPIERSAEPLQFPTQPPPFEKNTNLDDPTIINDTQSDVSQTAENNTGVTPDAQMNTNPLLAESQPVVAPLEEKPLAA